MKKFFLFFILIFSCLRMFAQLDSSQVPPYKRFPTVPAIQILLSDSSTLFTKNQLSLHKPVLIIVFNPECEHCQHETEDLIAHKKELKNIQILMITVEPLWKMNNFISKYGLNKYSNIVVGKDIYYILPGFYDIHNIPFLALYNKKGNLIEGHEGTMPMEKVIEVFKK